MRYGEVLKHAHGILIVESIYDTASHITPLYGDIAANVNHRSSEYSDMRERNELKREALVVKVLITTTRFRIR